LIINRLKEQKKYQSGKRKENKKWEQLHKRKKNED
jgi:hypothetical protein